MDSGPFLHIGAVVDVVMITYMGAVVEGIAVTTAINMNKCARKAQGMLSS